MVSYQKEYARLETPDPQFDIGDKVWYANPLSDAGKLAPTWKIKAIVVGKAVNSYSLQDEFGKVWIANQRLVKKRYDLVLVERSAACRSDETVI